MSTRVDQVTNNTFYNILPSKIKTREEITKEDEETFSPLEGKGWCELTQVNDFFSNPTEKDKEIFHKRWLFEIINDTTGQKIEKFVSRLVDNGYSIEEARANINYAISNGQRAKQTATIQESWGKKGSVATNVSIVVSVLKKIFGENLPKPVQVILDLIYGASKSTRSSYQGSLYNLNDDDASKNRFEADVYDNKVAGFFGTIGAFVETKINSWALTVIELFPENTKDSLKKILTSFNPLWFRSRMPALIRQSFFTDFFRWLFHIIPSLFRCKKSIEVINKVKERGNLKPSYFWKRTCKLSGLSDTKDYTFPKLVSQVFGSIKGLFSKDLNKQKDSAKKLNETIAPSLGIYGFFAMSIGAVCGSMLKVLNLENKFFDFLYSTSITSQQFIYFPRLVMPFFHEWKELEAALKSKEVKKEYTSKQIHKLRELAKKQRKLYYIGATCFLLSLLNSSLKIKNTENPILQKIKDTVDELTVDLIQKFFSERRHVIGCGFKTYNPEFYETEQTQTAESFEATKPVNVQG